MNPIDSAATTSLRAHAGRTGIECGKTGLPATSDPLPVRPEASTKGAPPALSEWQPILRKQQTNLTLLHHRDPATGKNITKRQHVLTVPMSEARASLSTLTDALLTGEREQVSQLIAPLLTLPRQGSDEAMTAKVYMMAVEGFPYASVSHAVQHYLFERPDQVFCPTPAQLRQTIKTHAETLHLKCRHLKEAIQNEEEGS